MAAFGLAGCSAVLLFGAAAFGAAGAVPPAPSETAQRGQGVASAQTPATGLVFGRVLEGFGDRPVAGATVSLGGVGPTRRVLTDDAGRFVFFDLAAGRYTLTADKAGHQFGEYGRDTPAGSRRSLIVAENERLSGLTVRIWKSGVIGGRVVDERGEPVVGVLVYVFAANTLGGQVRFTAQMAGRTDDRGVYRVADLSPASTYVVAVPAIALSVPAPTPGTPPRAPGIEFPLSRFGDFFLFGLNTPSPGAPNALAAGDRLLSWVGAPPPAAAATGAPLAYRTVFHPDVLDVHDATRISFAEATERTDIDFRLAPAEMSAVSGLVVDATGPAPRVRLALSPVVGDGTTLELDTAVALSDAAGRFSFPAVPPGTYRLQALDIPQPESRFSAISLGSPNAIPMLALEAEPLGENRTRWARQSVVIGRRPLTDLAVSLLPGVRLSGRLVFNGSTAPPAGAALERLRLTVETTAGGRIAPTMNLVGVDAESRFQSIGLPADRYFMRLSAPPTGWVLESAMYEGRDLSVEPVDLTRDLTGIVMTLGDRPTILSGVVGSVSGAADPDARVLVFPPRPAMWADFGLSPPYLKDARVGRDGAFEISGLPAGEYLVLAVPDAQASAWRNPDFIERTATSATRVRLDVGGTAQVALTTRVIR